MEGQLALNLTEPMRLMGSGLDAFAETKSRCTDPPTSRRAALAAAPRAGSQRERILDAIISAPAGLNYDEASEATSIVGVSVSTRISELARGGFIERNGTRETRAGGQADVWIATAAGRGRAA